MQKMMLEAVNTDSVTHTHKKKISKASGNEMHV